MFCRNCGSQVNDNAKFCSNCGKERMISLKKERKIIEDNQLRHQLIPEFNTFYKLLTIMKKALIYMMLIFILIINNSLMYPSSFVITIVIMGVYIIVKMIFEKKQYNDLEYNFYATKVEYKDGFLNKEEKELQYKYIREVSMSQSLLERICGVGTIRILTNASSGIYAGRSHNSMIRTNGIFIHCVENVEEQYRTIKQIIDEGIPEN